MKNLYLISILLFWTNISFAQITLCQENAYMYSICFELDSNGTFKYRYGHCTGSDLGMGKFTKTNDALIFHFKKLQSFKLKKDKNENLNGKVKISYHHVSSLEELELDRITYDNKIYERNKDTNNIVEINYSGGPIILYQSFGRDSIIIHPDKDNCNSYYLYWHNSGDKFIKGGKKIKMKYREGRYEYFGQLISNGGTNTKPCTTYFSDTKFYKNPWW